MTFSILRSASLALMLSVIPAIAESPFTRMVESKPVATNGLEFVAAVEDEWFCPNPLPYGQSPIHAQLFMHNLTNKPLLFSTYDTFGIRIKDASGNVVAEGTNRDGTRMTKSVVIGPGGKYCLSRNAKLGWNTDGKSHTFAYYDETGGETTARSLSAGSYTLSFWCESSENSVRMERWAWEHSEKVPLKDEDSIIARWSGKVVTKEVAFKIIDQ